MATVICPYCGSRFESARTELSIGKRHVRMSAWAPTRGWLQEHLDSVCANTNTLDYHLLGLRFLSCDTPMSYNDIAHEPLVAGHGLTAHVVRHRIQRTLGRLALLLKLDTIHSPDTTPGEQMDLFDREE